MCAPTTNAAVKKKVAINPLRLDPTRTTMLRRQFVAQMNIRFRALKGEINKLIVDEDAFGLAADLRAAAPGAGGLAAVLAANADTGQRRRDVGVLVANTRFRFLTNDKKVGAYRTWLTEQVEAGILEVSAANAATPWLEPYVESAYKKGALRAYTDARAAGAGTEEARQGATDEFLRTSFAAPTARAKVQQLATRAFTALRGVTAAMDAEMTRILSDGLTAGRGAREIARSLNKSVDNMTRKRALTIARTELVHAHSEGQLDSFERLGIEDLDVMAEWSTAHDDGVCPLCQPLEGAVLTVKEARGMIPRHPNCRCSWVPANVEEDRFGTTKVKHAGPGQGLSAPGTAPTGKTTSQAFDAAGARARINDSIKAERPGRSLQEAKARSRWVGADTTITGKRRRR